MRVSKENRKLIQIAGIAFFSILIIVLGAFWFVSNWEQRLIDERKQVCITHANLLSDEIEGNLSDIIFGQLMSDASLTLDSSNIIDKLLTGLIEARLLEIKGIEGGVYIQKIDDFMGYAFPTSPPPVPVYGPPPRSHKIIKEQAILSVEGNREIVGVHAFDPAVFPLATVPFLYKGEIVGAVWVRVHIERDLPLARLKRVINVVTILSLFGFLVMAMFSFFLRNGIRSIRRELVNTRKDSGYRLKKRGGWFGFIPASINEMLSTLEKENLDRRELEKELQQKEKMASLGKMIAGVAHEVKTPLSVVKTRVQMWEREVLKSREIQEKIQPDSLKLVLDEIDRLSLLVKRLVIFSRPIYENLTPVNLDVLIEEVLSMIDLHPSDRQISIVKSLEAGSNKIIADANSIKQVLINIMNNSVEAINSEGEIVILTYYNKDDNSVVLELNDSGEGIPEEIMGKVFDPFFTSKETGTGLGLTISHEIIAAHNGTITFRNRVEGGVNCTIVLPAQ